MLTALQGLSLNLDLSSIFYWAGEYFNAIWPLIAFIGGLGLAKAIARMVISMLKSF